MPELSIAIAFGYTRSLRRPLVGERMLPAFEIALMLVDAFATQAVPVPSRAMATGVVMPPPV